MYNSEEEYNDAMQGQAEHDMAMAAQEAEGEDEQARINAEAVNSALNTLLCAVYDAAKTGMPLNDETLIELYNTLVEELKERKVLSA